jgi:hypothetical protein
MRREALPLFLPQEGSLAAPSAPAIVAVSLQNTSEVPQKPKREQHTFNGQLVSPSAEYSPQGALASQLATHVLGLDGEQCSGR